MKTITTIMRVGATLVTAGALSLGAISTASAAGTKSGTEVRNTANLTYGTVPDVAAVIADLVADGIAVPDAGQIQARLEEIANVLTADVSNEANFLVDRRLDLEVLTTLTNVAVEAGGPGAGVRYEARLTIENQGNADDLYAFDIADLATSDFEFAGDVQLYSDVGQNGFTPDDVLLATYTPSTGLLVRNNVLPVAQGADPLNATPDVIHPDGAFAAGPVVGGTPNTPDAAACDIDVTNDNLDCQHQVTNTTVGLVLVTTADAAVPAGANDGQATRYRVTATSVVDDGSLDGTQPATPADQILLNTALLAVQDTAEDSNGNDAAEGNEVVFADGEDDSTNDIIEEDITLAQEGDDADDVTFIIGAAEFTFSKSQELICDPINGFANATAQAGTDEAPYHIPGAYVRYSITVANGAMDNPRLLTILSDNLQQDIRFDFDLIDPGQSGPDNCSPDGAAESPDGNIKVTLNGAVSYFTAVGAAAPDVPPDAAALATAGAFLITPGGAANSTEPDGTATTAGENILFVAISPAGPLGAPARLNETTPPRLPGQLDAAESITIEFNAILR